MATELAPIVGKLALKAIHAVDNVDIGDKKEFLKGGVAFLEKGFARYKEQQNQSREHQQQTSRMKSSSRGRSREREMGWSTTGNDGSGESFRDRQPEDRYEDDRRGRFERRDSDNIRKDRFPHHQHSWEYRRTLPNRHT